MKPAIPFSMIVKHVLIVVVFNSLVAGILLLTGESRWDIQFVYAQAIGLSIYAIMEVGRFTLFPNPETRWPRGYWGGVLVVLSIVLGYSIGTVIGDAYCGCSTWSMTGMDHHGLVTSLLTTFIAGGIASAYFYVRGRAMYARAKAAMTAQALADAKLKLLESQLEPHMLFNTLANLRVLISHDPDRAEAMLDRLIAFLRATLAGSRESTHSLADEFARLDDYLALMKVRMGDRLQTRLALPEPLQALRVPPHLLQPLVENAIKHGLEPHVEGGLIEISARAEGQALVLTVCDTGVGLRQADLGTADEPSSHFGLTHVRERLMTLYGASATLTLEPGHSGALGDSGGAIATIRIPWAACQPASDDSAAPERPRAAATTSESARFHIAS